MEYGRLVEGLEDQKQLQITKLVLCRSVSGYGRYEAFYDNRFRMGALPLILVYTELANSKPQQRSDGRHVVRLTEELALWDAANEKEVWHSDPVSVTDESSSRRRDFFLAQYLRLPASVRPGQYNLRVRSPTTPTAPRPKPVSPWPSPGDSARFGFAKLGSAAENPVPKSGVR